jgi:hypothetical protein
VLTVCLGGVHAKSAAQHSMAVMQVDSPRDGVNVSTNDSNVPVIIVLCMVMLGVTLDPLNCGQALLLL